MQRAVRQAIDGELHPLGLRIQEYRALIELRDNPSISGVSLAKRLQHSPQAIQPMLVRLESAGLVERRAGLSRSNLEVRLTERGEDVLRLADSIVTALNTRVNTRLGSSTTAALLHLLEAAQEAVEVTSQPARSFASEPAAEEGTPA